MKRVMGVVALVLCACGLVVAGCGSSVAGTSSAGTGGPAATTTLYPVSVDGKYGYIDKTGALVIKPQFDHADEFSEGLAVAVITENSVQKCGYIDKTGTWVIQPQFYHAGDFSEGLAAVTIESRVDAPVGFIDNTGRLVIAAQYNVESIASKFSEGLCSVTIENDGEQQKWGYIDKTGSMVIEPQFSSQADFSEGLAVTSLGTDYVLIDQKGKQVAQLPGGWTSVNGAGFSEGVAVVCDLFPDTEHATEETDYLPRMGYIDKSGAVAIKLQFVWATDFSEGLAAVGIVENGVAKYGYIDKTGAWVIQPQFDLAGPFKEGVAAVGTVISGTSGKSGAVYRYSFVDKTGEVAIQLQQGQVPGFFSGGRDFLGVSDTSTHIDTAGKLIWQGK